MNHNTACLRNAGWTFLENMMTVSIVRYGRMADIPFDVIDIFPG